MSWFRIKQEWTLGGLMVLVAATALPMALYVQKAQEVEGMRAAERVRIEVEEARLRLEEKELILEEKELIRLRDAIKAEISPPQPTEAKIDENTP